MSLSKTYAVRKKNNGYQVVWFYGDSYFSANGYDAYEHDVDGAFFKSPEDAENEAMNLQYK